MIEPPLLLDAPLTIGVAYLVDVVARSHQECCSL